MGSRWRSQTSRRRVRVLAAAHATPVIILASACLLLGPPCIRTPPWHRLGAPEQSVMCDALCAHSRATTPPLSLLGHSNPPTRLLYPMRPSLLCARPPSQIESHRPSCLCLSRTAANTSLHAPVSHTPHLLCCSFRQRSTFIHKVVHPPVRPTHAVADHTHATRSIMHSQNPALCYDEPPCFSCTDLG